MNLDRIQQAIAEQGIDGWLFYDFHHRDTMAYHILGLDFIKFTT
ncbi:MAG: aminopeptidase P family protein, partial [Bacteroidetes bacterium]|nr:aminopeptidase P family protein [Bacteroidota bacterium]